jgi:hypothetical protein
MERRNHMMTDSPDDNCGPVNIAKFKCSIGGDQTDMYPKFVEAARAYIKQRGLSKWDR